MKKMKSVINVIRLLVLVAVLLAWYSNSQAQCYQNEVLHNDGSAELYEYFCTGYWLHGFVNGYRTTIYYDSRYRKLHICGQSVETHNLCTFLHTVKFDEKKDMLIISGVAGTYDAISKLRFKQIGEFVHVIAYDGDGKELYESKNFEWYSY